MAWNNSEVHKIKQMVDSLHKKLHNELKELNLTIKKAEEKISFITAKIVIVKKVQDLLAQLSNQSAHEKMCKHRYVVPGFLYKQNIVIKTQSTLPSQYTANVKGNSCL